MKKVLIIGFFLLMLFSASTVAHATNVGDFKPIVPIPGVDFGSATFADYLNTIFGLIIQVGAILAVLMIVWGGFEYMTSAAGVTKKDGADRIRGAITGLILLLASYLILFVINPCLVKIELFSGGSSNCSPTTVETTDTTTTEPDGPEYSSAGTGECLNITSAMQCAPGVPSVKICMPQSSSTEWREVSETTFCNPDEVGRRKCPCEGDAQAEAGVPINVESIPTIAGVNTEPECLAQSGLIQSFCCPLGSSNCLLMQSGGTQLQRAAECADRGEFAFQWVCARPPTTP